MKINSVSNVNFGSNVKFTEDFKKTPEEKLGGINSSIIKSALEELEENGKDDTVKVFITDGWEDYILAMKVEKEINGQKYEGTAKMSLFYKNLSTKDVHKIYDEAAQKADSMKTPAKESIFSKYM